MLDRMRTHSQNWLIYLIFGAIIIVFSINFGPGFDQLNQTGCGRGKTTAATINGTSLPRRLYEMHWRNFVQNQRIPSYLQSIYRGQILDQLVNIYLLAQEADKYGIKVSDDEVDKELLKDTSFHNKGIFDKEYFRSLITRFRLTTQEYKEFVRLRLQADRMRQMVSSGVAVSEQEARQDFALKNEKVQIEYVAFDAKKLKATFKITATEADAFIKKEEKRLRAYYDANLNKFTKLAKVRTRHLILTFAQRGKPTTEELNKLKDRIDVLYKEAIKDPKKFEALARKHSKEPGASKSGGLLPFIEEGAKNWDPDYVKAAFKLKTKGEISKPVKSSFGYHIIQLVERQEADKRPLSKRSVKEEIARVLLQQDKAASFIESNVKELLAHVKKNKTLKEAIQQLLKSQQAATPAKTTSKPAATSQPGKGKTAPKPAKDPLSGLLKQQLKVVTSPPFPLDAESIPGIKQVGTPIYPLIRAAFLLTEKKPWSEKPIKVLDKVYIIRLKKRTHANFEKFEKEKSDFLNSILARRRKEFQSAWLESVRKQAKIQRNSEMLKSRDF